MELSLSSPAPCLTDGFVRQHEKGRIEDASAVEVRGLKEDFPKVVENNIKGVWYPRNLNKTCEVKVGSFCLLSLPIPASSKLLEEKDKD